MKVQRARLTPLGGPLPTVTVVVPCYNYGHYLSACVESVLNQIGVHVQVHIIDDASTDGSHLVCQELAATDGRISVTLHAVNQGHINTYNEGLAAVETDYVVLLSADDMLTAGSLHRATSLMEANPTVGLAYGHPVEFSGEPPLTQTRSRTWTTWRGRSWIQAQFGRGLSIIYCPEAVVRTSVQHRVGYYRPELPHSGDLEMWLRIADASDVGRVNGADQALRRYHPASMMRTQYATVVMDLRERQRAYLSFLDSSNLSPSSKQSLLSLVSRRQCEEALDWALSQMDNSVDSQDGWPEAVEYARSTYEGHRNLLVWKSYLSRSESSGLSSMADGVLTAYDAWARNIGNRIRWQRWRRYGI